MLRPRDGMSGARGHRANVCCGAGGAGSTRADSGESELQARKAVKADLSPCVERSKSSLKH